jgi:hypothetical protein
MEFSKNLHVAPMGCTAVQVQDALKSVVQMLTMRGHIGQPVAVYRMDNWDGHYCFLVSGLQYDVERVIRDWQAMDEERIG